MNNRNAKKLNELIIGTGIVKHWLVKNPSNKKKLLNQCKEVEPINDNIGRIFDKTTNSISEDMKNLVAFMFLVQINKERMNKRLKEIHEMLLASIPEVKTDSQWTVFCKNAYPNLVQEGLEIMETQAYEEK